MNRRYKQQKPMKVCIICGDRATGINFGCLSCMSCKAFFRRNALRTKVFQCPFEDRCVITRITRKFCAKCRIKRCFEVGMKKEWILSEEEKQEMKERIARNRELKQQKMMQQLEILQQHSSGGTGTSNGSSPHSECTSCRSPPSGSQSPTESSTPTSPAIRQSVIVTPTISQSSTAKESTRPATPPEASLPDFAAAQSLSFKSALPSPDNEKIFATKTYLQFLPKLGVDAS